GTRAPDLDALVARAVANRPGEMPLYLSLDEDRPVANVTTAASPDAPAAAMHFQSLDRRTGAVLPPPHGAGITAFVLRLHTDMLLGQGAEFFLGAMGALFVAAIVSGVVLYVPFMARLGFGTVRRERGAQVRRLDRHNLLGIATLAWAVVVGLTGTVNTLVVPVTGLWKADQLAAIADPDGPRFTGRLAPLQPAVDAAMRAAPATHLQFVAFPGVAFTSRRHYGLFLQGTTPLTRRLLTPAFVDAGTGRLDAVRPMPWYMAALLLAQPLHFGDYAGLPLKLIWAVLDVLTIAVLVGGLRLWAARLWTGHDRIRAMAAIGTA
uniref:PepSY-associated TM helix domain-containing protein n=1 Tax=Sphingomonas bacterium TaxID=1895847 RepID=UPI0015769232